MPKKGKPDWQIFYFKLFRQALDETEQAVSRLARKQPSAYQSHPRTRLLASVYKCITQLVPADPSHADFRLGKTLGAEYTNWRRVKQGMPDPYCLFFRFAARPVPVIAYVWFNDEGTLRTAGSRTDVYEGFKRMLMRGEVPDSIDALLSESRKP